MLFIVGINFSCAILYLTAVDLSKDEIKKIRKSFNNLTNLQGYPFSALELSAEIDEEQVADVFVRINSQGKKLNQADFILTLMSVFWEDERRDLEGFYSHLFELEFHRQPNPSERNSIKSDIMYVLFEGNRNHRKRVEGVRLINKYYPFVNRTIEYLIDTIGGRDFAVLLQRLESQLVIDHIVPRFHEECPDAPIITIHDSIITDEKHSLFLEEIMREILLRETQIEPGLKVEKLMPRPLMEKDLKDIYEKIKRKSTKRKFKKIEWSLLDRNIKHAEAFISNYIPENHE